MPFQSLYSTGTYSSSSLDLCQLFPRAESRTVISETFSLDSLSTTSSDDIPPFPSGYAPPIATTLSLGSRLSMFPLSSRKFGEFSLDDQATVFVTSPTTPRLKTMLKETLCVGRWVESIPLVDAPGHIPWADVEDVPPTYWIPEGSIYPPEEFREALLSKRYSRQQNSQKVDRSPAPPSERPEDRHPINQTSCRNTLVFEREITLNTGGQARRLSLQVPADSMNPEMVDLMLELKGLNLFFQGESGGANLSVESLDKETKCILIPPALVVSNSECSVPILLDSVGDSPLTLAVRRGKRIPPPLSLKREAEQDPYSSIPTAFLGSPSTYSPKFEFANLHDDPAMDLEDMVANLRSHCSSFLVGSPVVSSFPEVPKTKGRSIYPQAQFPADDDEWAFANNLLETYGDLVRSESLFLSQNFNHLPLSLSSLSNSSTDVDSESATGTDQSPYASVKSVDLGRNLTSKQARSDQCSLKTASTPWSNRPPSAVLPLRPALASPTSPKFTRGILKRCKSVRFASLPSRHEVSPCPTKTPLPRRSTGASTVTPRVRQPSPLRNGLVPQNVTSRPGTPAVSPLTRAADVASTDSRKKSASTQAPATRSTSTATSVKRAAANTFPFRRPTTKQIVVSGEKQSSQVTATTSLGRHSLGRLIRATPARGKENKTANSFPNASCWSTLDENMLRRGSKGGVPESRMNKSRMPVPLRNIFTRFK